MSNFQTPQHGGPWRGICASILKNQEAKKMATQGIRCKVGNGKKALFWHDTWIGDRPLKLLFPRLYSITTIKDAPIEAIGS